jgi:hypothetical protein
VRATTPRLTVAWPADCARDVAADALARVATERPAGAFVTVPLDASPRAVAPDERDVAPEPRGLCADGAICGAIGSAKTARIDKNVEHTKNAAASRNTVPAAFLNISPILRVFIIIPCNSKSGIRC